MSNTNTNMSTNTTANMIDFYQLDITFSKTEGALIRMIGTIERRGFNIDSLNVTPATAETMKATITS